VVVVLFVFIILNEQCVLNAKVIVSVFIIVEKVLVKNVDIL